MRRRSLILGVVCSLLCTAPSVVQGSSKVHTGLNISNQYVEQLQEKERVHADLQRQVDSLQRELERVQKKSSKQKTKLDDIKKKYKILKSDYDSLSAESKGTSYDSFIITEGSVSDHLLSLVESELDYVDLNFLKKLHSLGWAVIVTDRDIASVYYRDTSLGSLAGLTSYNKSKGKKICYISARENAIKSATLHEIGHAIQYENGNLLKSSDTFFSDVWANEKGTLRELEPDVRDYDVHAPDEYFAEYFFRWCHNKELQEECKGTHEYLSNYMDAIMNDTNIALD